ncbi:MAG: aminopeptidase P family protein [Gemmatimonadota bacterium]|nr:MAG: aminopeptidase P family protein [Gemmatimonadota bacterium]
MLQSISITATEFTGRCTALLERVHKIEADGVVLFDAVNILYFTGFAFIPTERPMAFAMNALGERALFVPRLEVEHAKSATNVDRVEHYLEYPGDRHPMHGFKEMLAELGIGRAGTGRIAADLDGYPWIFGYEGPTLTELAGVTVVKAQGEINRLQAVKSEAELQLIRESCKWANLAHTLLQRYTAVGESETSVSMRASQEATLAMLDAIGPIFHAQSWPETGPRAEYRGQIGRSGAIPHTLANNIVFQPGDVLVSEASCPVWAYTSELERTMFVGEPTKKQREMFEHVLAAQEVAFSTLRPGIECSDVDIAVRTYYADHNLMPYWKHHTGHSVGLRYHEGPFLDSGDHTVVKEGMVFTVEPGFYVPELGGFRHSDTVAVTANGIEILTHYPRDAESLTIPA